MTDAFSPSSSSGLSRGSIDSDPSVETPASTVRMDRRNKSDDDGMDLAAELAGEAADIQRRIAYFDYVRSLHKTKRTVGIVGCLIGCLVMLWGSERGPDVLRYVGLVIVGARWLLFIYVTISRAMYVKKNPLEARN